MLKSTTKNSFLIVVAICIIFSAIQFTHLTAYAGGLGEDESGYSPQIEIEHCTSTINSEDTLERPPDIQNDVCTTESPPQVSNPPNTSLEETSLQSGDTIINNYETNNYYSLFQINGDWNWNWDWDWDWDFFKESEDNKSGIFQSILDAVNGNIVPAFLYLVVGCLTKLLPDSKVLMLIYKFLEKDFHSKK